MSYRHPYLQCLRLSRLPDAVTLQLGLYGKSYFKEEFSEEDVISTLVPVTEEPSTDHPMESNGSSSIGLTLPVPLVLTSEQIKPSRKSRQQTPLPTALPPNNDMSQNTLGEWCPYHNLYGWQES